MNLHLTRDLGDIAEVTDRILDLVVGGVLHTLEYNKPCVLMFRGTAHRKILHIKHLRVKMMDPNMSVAQIGLGKTPAPTLAVATNAFIGTIGYEHIDTA